METTPKDLFPAFSDKRITHGVRTTKKHPAPFVTFRDSPLVPVSGTTQFTPGTKVRIFYSGTEHYASVPPAKGDCCPLWFLDDGAGHIERWMWESNKA